MLFVRKWRGVVSLLDMLRFYAQSFVSSTSTVTQLLQFLQRGELQESHIKPLGQSLGELTREVQKCDLPLTLKQIGRIQSSMQDGSLTQYSVMRQQFEELMNRLWDELDSNVFYQIESSKSAYVNAEWLFGTPIQRNFPSAWKELQSAGRCFAYGENTAWPSI